MEGRIGKMNQTRKEWSGWPAWLSELGPDDLTRERLRRSIAVAAAPLLEARRVTWWEVASSWASLLIPIAASIALLVAGLAIGDRPVSDSSTALAAADEALAYEEFVEWASAEELPRAFPEDSLADLDVVLTTITTEP
jgi:hypothetical protein